MQKTAGPKKIISRFDDRQYAKNDIFSTLKFFKIFYIVNLDNLNCFSSFEKNQRSKQNLQVKQVFKFNKSDQLQKSNKLE